MRKANADVWYAWSREVLTMDPLTSAALITGGSSIIGGLIGGSGQSKANKVNAQLAREQMHFQKVMSDTAVRRRMNDLREAGINPILAAKYDATTPPGALAQMGNVGGAALQGANAVASTMSTAIGASKTAKDAEMVDNLLSSSEVTEDIFDLFQGTTSKFDKIVDEIGNEIFDGWTSHGELQDEMARKIQEIKSDIDIVQGSIAEKVGAFKNAVKKTIIEIRGWINE